MNEISASIEGNQPVLHCSAATEKMALGSVIQDLRQLGGIPGSPAYRGIPLYYDVAILFKGGVTKQAKYVLVSYSIPVLG